MRSGPMFILLILPVDQRRTRDALGLSCHQRGWSGVEWREYVLSLPGRWMVPGKQEKREGNKVPLLMPIGEGTRAALQTSSIWPRARPSRVTSWSVPWVPCESLGPGEVLYLAPGLHSTRPIEGPL